MSLAPAMSSWFANDFQTSRSYHCADPKIETGDEPTPVSGRSSLPTVLWDVGSGSLKRHAIKPITVELRTEGPHWLAENETLRIFANGPTVAAALENFQDHLIYFHGYYAELKQDEVIGDAVRLKKLFASIFA